MPICHEIEGNRLRLDGGAMFGNVPRALWSRWCVPDDSGRIELATRCLLVEDGTRRVLLETGIGVFFDPRLRDRYGVSDPSHRLIDSLSARGVSPEEIDVVVLSHLHFDHAGGLLAPWREGRPPELAFPRAQFVIGARAWERAQTPHPRDRASFIPGLLELLEASGRVVRASGATCASLGPAYTLHETEGHTPGLLHVRVQGSAAALVYCSDLIPGVPWLHLPVTMGYDRFPEKLIDEKAELLERSLVDRTWLFFTHDPKIAAARVERDASGRYGALEARASLAPGLDLDRCEEPS